MVKTKVTMRDIAKALDVSVATVSYVLNHSEKEKISHETRIKVMETAKKMGYVPNLSARSLASKRSNLIGIIINIGKNASRFKKDRYYDLAMELQQQLSKKGYDTIVSITEEIRQRDLEIASKRLLEAVFVIDIDEKYLQEVTCHTYVPVIFLECILGSSPKCVLASLIIRLVKTHYCILDKYDTHSSVYFLRNNFYVEVL